MNPAALLSPPGPELLERLRGEDVTPDRALALSGELRARFPADLVALALTQQALRASARAKFSRADQMLFTRPGLEQASSEVAAAHSAARLRDFPLVADLCCGIGGNLAALAAGSDVLAVDRDPATLALARHNAAAGGARRPVTAVCADVRDLARLPPAVYIDPARRAGGRRLRAGDCEPPLEWCLALPAPAVCVKAAPGLPRELIPAGWEAEFVAVGRELKEALLWSPALATAPRRATILAAGDTLTEHTLTDDISEGERGGQLPVAPPGAYLLDPSPAVTRAGLVQALGRRLGAWQIDPMIAFLSTSRPVVTPFARTLRVLESMPWHEKRAARRLRELGIGSADIRRRGLAGDVEQIRRRLGLTGDGAAAVIVLTRREDRPWGLICARA